MTISGNTHTLTVCVCVCVCARARACLCAALNPDINLLFIRTVTDQDWHVIIYCYCCG